MWGCFAADESFGQAVCGKHIIWAREILSIHCLKCRESRGEEHLHVKGTQLVNKTVHLVKVLFREQVFVPLIVPYRMVSVEVAKPKDMLVRFLLLVAQESSCLLLLSSVALLWVVHVEYV